MSETPSFFRAADTARSIGLVAGPVLAAAVVLFSSGPATPPVLAAAIAVLMAVWWMTEALPLAATSLLPLVLFPVFGIMPAGDTAAQYMNNTIMLFFGAFLIAIAMQRWRLHERIALRVLSLTGSSPTGVMTGFMLATAFLSMWVSNTATAMMMVPIAIAVLSRLETESGREAVAPFSSALLLTIAYSASIGGIATLVGTPPNLAFDRFFRISFPDAEPVSFLKWMLLAAPFCIVMLAVMFAWLKWTTRSVRLGAGLERGVIRRRLADLGPITFEQIAVLVVFSSAALLWITRAPVSIGDVTIPGWSSLFENSKFLSDGTVAIALATVLFIVPSRGEKGARLLDETAFREVPWGIVLLFGGGFALAAGFTESGLSEWIGLQLQGLAGLHPLLLIGTVCLVVTFLTELTSNTATANILLPLLATMGTATGIDPVLLMAAGAISCSCAFMLPVATPPNAIAFASDRITIRGMMKTGFVLNVAGAVLVTLVVWFWGRVVF